MSSMQAQSTDQTPSRKTHFRGVRKRSSNRFAAEIRDPQKRRRVWLGTYNSDIEAAHAYDLAARAIKGWKAKTNFPLSYFQNPNSILQRTTHNNPQPHEEKVVAPSWINSNMVAKAAASSSSSLSDVIFPPELQRQQQLAALKMSDQRRCDESEGVMGVINGRGKESDSPSNSSHPSSSTITECTDYPTTGDTDLMAGVDLNLPASSIDLMAAGDFAVGIDLNLPAPDLERDECGNSCKTLWLFK